MNTGEAKLELRFITPEVQIVKPEVYINKFVYGKSNLYDNYVGKVILLVGATGAGKSTLVNAMLNHIKRVKLEDNYRYELIKEAEDQDKSQTEYITSYTFHPDSSSQIKDTITIIDTPGFADTKGIEADKYVFKKLQDFFLLLDDFSINEVHLIGIVVPNSRVRLDATEKYIYNQILSLFGKDVSKNVSLLVTHMDLSKEPKQVLHAAITANIPVSGWYGFNNGYLFEDPPEDEEDRSFVQLEHLECLLKENNKGKEKKENVKMPMEVIMKDFAQEAMQVHRLICEVHACLVKLYKIALKKDAPDIIEYIELLIQREETTSHPGHLQRLKHLQEIREVAEYLKEMQYGRGFFPFEEKLKLLDKKGFRLVTSGDGFHMEFHRKGWLKRLLSRPSTLLK
ncbi:unnamed protein product [Darwinula stevensoni]|uniref:AIG1-type G domain-containing protein n=1 Tax=Darwinula stevensoni TaxID=69355 RepID=A0A7R8X4Y7_9CRUS|nr:unnamed protein product [Darwinula stevensoni]CAG0885485.1 unnamed protein product [Darwinula stevensoni]